MSNFPDPINYKKSFSKHHIDYLLKYNITPNSNIIIKKLKHQFIYDIDNYKYVDFFLNNGSVIYGHSYGTITHFIKNGISCGIESSYHNKFEIRLIKLFENLLEFKNISFYSNQIIAFYNLFKNLKIKNITVNTKFLFNLIKYFSPDINVEYITSNKHSKLLLFEPINMDTDLSIFNYKEHSADYYISYESRTSFRLKYGFICNLEDIDAIITSNNIANGIDCCVIFSNFYLPTEILPIYKTIAILETLKFYKRKINYESFEIKGKILNYINKNKNIFNLKINFNQEELLKYGIFLNDNIGFLCYQHTYHDIRRLFKAIESIKNYQN